MPATDPRQPLLQFLSSVSDISGKTEEELIRILLEAKQYQELQDVLKAQMDEIVTALKTKDVPKLQLALNQTFLAVKQKIASLPDQVAMPIEKSLPETPEETPSLAEKSQRIRTVLQESPQILETLKKSQGETKRAYIEKLVKNYSKWAPEQSNFIQQTTERVIAVAQTHPEASLEQIIKQAIPQTFPSKDVFVAKLQKDSAVKQEIRTIQKETPKEISSSFVEALINAPDPVFFKDAYVQSAQTTPSLQLALEKAKTLSGAGALLTTAGQEKIQYDGFFTKMSSSGSFVEKLLAPAADTVFSLFPKGIQEEIVTRVLGTSWTKEVSNNSFLQKILGPTLQSSPIQEAIKRGNQLFVPSGQKNVVFSKTQTFFADIFVTVFHPQVSEVYLRLAGLNNATMNKSVGQFYLGQLADRGATYAAKKGATAAGKVVAEKAAGSTLGKIIGTLLGGEGGPVGSFIGAVVFDKIIGGLWSGVKKGFNFITLDWLGKLITGNYESTPIQKDPAFIISAVVVFFVALLFVVPLTPFTLVGNSLFQQTVQDNAFIQGLGTGDETGPSIDCTEEPNNPLCSMKSCETSKQDCRWPTSGYITQGPYTACGGTHSNANAIDIGGASGADVYATIEGTVDFTYTGCEDNKGFLGNQCGHYLGNYVVIKGMCNNGETSFSCTLTFGHLKAASIHHVAGQTVQATDVIGEMDHSGSSSGPHLHFSLKDTSHSINEILPFAIDHCVNSTTGCTPCAYPRVGGGQ